MHYRLLLPVDCLTSSLSISSDLRILTGGLSPNSSNLSLNAATVISSRSCAAIRKVVAANRGLLVTNGLLEQRFQVQAFGLKPMEGFGHRNAEQLATKTAIYADLARSMFETVKVWRARAQIELAYSFCVFPSIQIGKLYLSASSLLYGCEQLVRAPGEMLACLYGGRP